MKFFAYIFSIYILALSVMPCSDASNDCRSKTEVAERADAHSHKSDHNDTCSPFCICSCCNTPVNITFDSFSIKVNKPVATSLKIPVFNFFFASNYYGSIWKPPKIS